MYNREMVDVSQSHGGGFGGAAMGMWAFIIFVILIIFFVFYKRDGYEGGHGNHGGYGYAAPIYAAPYPYVGHEGKCGPSNCQLEVREILDAKQTQLDLCKDTAKVIESNNKGYETILAKMSNDALLAATAKNVEQAALIAELKQNALITREVGGIKEELGWIKCHMLPKPEVHGVGTVCPPNAVLRGFEGREDGCGCRG